jgi:uncharacterized alpha-E superfamily protein
MFLLSNDILPRSVAFNIHELESKIEILQLTKSRVYDDFKFKISRLNSQLHYLVHQDLNESPNNYLLSLIEQINELAFVFNNEYLT